jgi:hypothetical protein
MGLRFSWILGLAAVAAVAAAPVRAADDSPDALMTKILASYAVTSVVDDPNAMLGSKYWDPEFTKLDEDNSKLMDGVDVLDDDPVCGCQDVGGHYHFTGKMTGPNDYVATVSMDEEPKGAPWQVIWKRMAGKWLIYDVIDDTGDIRQLLIKHNACARAKIAAHQPTNSCADVK